MKRLLWLWGPAVIQMTVIFVASAIPDLQAIPGGISDHTGHFLGYALLGALIFRAVAGGQWDGLTPAAAVLAWSLSAAYGVTDEWHQHYVPGRFSTVDDWVADALGAATAIGGLLAIRAVRRRWSRAV